jgi:DNA-binding LacI/PurR family transcriptional regulator
VPDVDAVVIQHDGEKASIAECVRRLMRRELPPTALLVNQSHHYLTVASILAQLGRRIPQDVSLICRDEDRFLSYLEPEPARYVEDPHDFARKLARITVKLVHERPEETPRAYIIPALVRGASLARPERPA